MRLSPLLFLVIGIVTFCSSCFANTTAKDLLEFTALSGSIVVSVNPNKTVEGVQFRRCGDFLVLIVSSSGSLIRDNSWPQQLRTDRMEWFYRQRSLFTIEPSVPNFFGMDIYPGSPRFSFPRNNVFYAIALMRKGRINSEIVCSSFYQFEIADSKIIESGLKKTRTLPKKVFQKFETELKALAKEEFFPYDRIKSSLNKVLDDF